MIGQQTVCAQCGAVVARSKVAEHYSACKRRPPAGVHASWWLCPDCGGCEVIGTPAAIHHAVFLHVCPPAAHEVAVTYQGGELAPWLAVCKCGAGEWLESSAAAFTWSRTHTATERLAARG